MSLTLKKKQSFETKTNLKLIAIRITQNSLFHNDVLLSDEEEKGLLIIEDDTNYEVFGNSEPKTLSTAKRSSTSSQMRKDLKLFANTCDKFQIPDRAAAALSFALLYDLEIASPQKNNFLLTKSKLGVSI